MSGVSFACVLLSLAKAASAQTCDMKAAGQKSLYIPGGKGVGCNAGGVKDCCFCVDDIAKCVKVFKDACYYTNEARRKEGFNGCQKITTTPEPAPVLPVAPKCSMTAAGQKALYIPGRKGVGCNAGGVKDCCYCVDDMAACAKTFGAGPCEATYNARRKQGFTGCNKTDPMPEPAPTLASAQTCKAKAAGQKAVFIPGGKGVGCNAGGVKDCCFCIEEDGWTACVTAFGEKPCEATYNARLKQGFEYCHKIEMTPEPVSTLSSAQTCDIKAAGQKTVFIPGGKGVGCNAGGVKDCCYCVDDMAACTKAFGAGPCNATYNARRKQGFDHCHKIEESMSEIMI